MFDDSFVVRLLFAISEKYGKVNFFSTADFLDKKFFLKIFNCLTHSLQEQAYGYGGKDRGKRDSWGVKDGHVHTAIF